MPIWRPRKCKYKADNEDNLGFKNRVHKRDRTIEETQAEKEKGLKNPVVQLENSKVGPTS